MDINTNCMQFEKEGVRIVIGDQSDPAFWRKFKTDFPEALDIFIDDGGHQMKQQTVTLDEMFWHVRDGGVYLCEDLHTSYWQGWGGSYLNSDTMIERSKALVDTINAWHSHDDRLQVIIKGRIQGRGGGITWTIYSLTTFSSTNIYVGGQMDEQHSRVGEVNAFCRSLYGAGNVVTQTHIHIPTIAKHPGCTSTTRWSSSTRRKRSPWSGSGAATSGFPIGADSWHTTKVKLTKQGLVPCKGRAT